MSRKSIAMQMDIQREFCDTMQELREIWDEIGIPDDQIESRGSTVLLHIRNLLEDMVKEEQNLKTSMLLKIEKHRQDIAELTLKLSVPAEEADLTNANIMQEEKLLRVQVMRLTKIKSERMCSLASFKSVEQELCDQLCSTPCYIPTGTIPSEKQLKQLQDHIETLKKEKSRRKNVFSDRKARIVQIYDALNLVPETSFAQDLVTEELDSFCLTNGKLEELEDLHDDLAQKKMQAEALTSSMWQDINALWDRLDVAEGRRRSLKKECNGIKPHQIKKLKEALAELEAEKIVNLQKLTEKARSEILVLWEKCFYSGEQRQLFTQATEENYTEALLDAHEEELAKMHAYFEEHQEMFTNVNKWQKLFQRMLELEEKAHDPNRYSNRGGNLLQEEKERKRIQKQLPKIEEELFAAIESWEEQREKPFLVEGIRFNDFVHSQWEAFERRKENEKQNRQIKKQQETRAEMTFGSTPKTPTKRRFIGTTTILKTPTSNKKAKRNPMDSTWRSVATTSNQNRTAATAYTMTSSPGKPPISTRLRTPMSAKKPPRTGAKRALNDLKQDGPKKRIKKTTSSTLSSLSSNRKTTRKNNTQTYAKNSGKICTMPSASNSSSFVSTSSNQSTSPSSSSDHDITDMFSTTVLGYQPKIALPEVTPSKYVIFESAVTGNAKQNKHVRSSEIGL